MQGKKYARYLNYAISKFVLLNIYLKIISLETENSNWNIN